MKIEERPILFSTPMVQSILQGKKFMTRRIVKPQPDESGLWNDDKFPRYIDSDLKGWNGTVENTGESKQFRCPYGKVGDQLWVRETWQNSECFEVNVKNRFFYKANHYHKELADEHNIKWKPSIFMPRVACRIILEITNIRVERLQDITVEDAMKEGVESEMMEYGYAYKDYMKKITYHFGTNAAKHSFKSLWIKLNGVELWHRNPWVWVIEFKSLRVCYKTHKPCKKDFNGFCSC